MNNVKTGGMKMRTYAFTLYLDRTSEHGMIADRFKVAAETRSKARYRAWKDSRTILPDLTFHEFMNQSVMDRKAK